MGRDLVRSGVTDGGGKEVDGLYEPRGRAVGAGVALGVANVDAIANVVRLLDEDEQNAFKHLASSRTEAEGETQNELRSR
jgi:hypothetical protein